MTLSAEDRRVVKAAIDRAVRERTNYVAAEATERAADRMLGALIDEPPIDEPLVDGRCQCAVQAANERKRYATKIVALKNRLNASQKREEKLKAEVKSLRDQMRKQRALINSMEQKIKLMVNIGKRTT